MACPPLNGPGLQMLVGRCWSRLSIIVPLSSGVDGGGGSALIWRSKTRGVVICGRRGVGHCALSEW